MKKHILYKADLPTYLLYASLFMLFLRMPLASYAIVDYNNPLSITMMGAAIGTIGLGSILRLYQQKQVNSSYLRHYLKNVAVGVVVVAIMMATGAIHVPAFISQLF